MTAEENSCNGVISNGSSPSQTPSKLRLLKHIWPTKEDQENFEVDNINSNPLTDTTTNVEKKEDTEIIPKSKKRGFFTLRTRKKTERDTSSLDESEDENNIKEYKLGEFKLQTEDNGKFKDAHRINMSPLSKSAAFVDNDSMLGNSDSEMSSEIITTIAPEREITSRNDSIQISTELNIRKEDKTLPLSKASNSVYTLVSENKKSSLVSLYVGDLDKSVSELDLKSFFSDSPGLISVKIPRNSLTAESLGYGYVNIENYTFANEAMEKLNYTKLGSSEVRIMPSIRDKTEREKSGTNVFVSHLPPNLSTRILYDKFKEFGKILSCKYSAERNTCFINFDDKINAFKVCKLFNKTEMDGHTILASIHILKKDRVTFQTAKNPFKVQESLSSTSTIENGPAHKAACDHEPLKVIETSPPNVDFKITKINTDSATLVDSTKVSNEAKTNTQFSIFIRNLPMFIKDDVIKGLVEQYGIATSVLSRKVPTKQGAWALVTMTNKDAVDKAVAGLNLVEVDGKQLFVTRAIPREQKAYARRNDTFPKKKRKILISGLDMTLYGAQLEKWCSQYPSIKSVEMYGTTQGGNGNNSYGYIEIDNEEDTKDLMIKLKSLRISCYKVMIETPNTDANFETPKYPYMMQVAPQLPGYFDTNRNISPVSFSYVDPTKMYQIADLNNKVTFDKYSELNRRDSYVKKRIVKNEEDQMELIINKINEIIWELAVRMFTPIRGNTGFKSVNTVEVINKTKVSSLSEHMIKFFWAKNVDEFYHFLKINQCDNTGNIILPPHPLIERQLVQSAMYLGIIPKQ